MSVAPDTFTFAERKAWNETTQYLADKADELMALAYAGYTKQGKGVLIIGFSDGDNVGVPLLYVIGKYTETEIDDDVRRRGALATADSAKLNRLAIETGAGTILSSYQVSTGDTLWVMTEADWATAPVTTIMTPEEY